MNVLENMTMRFVLNSIYVCVPYDMYLHMCRTYIRVNIRTY